MTEKSLSDKILEPLPGLTCICGKCDLRKLDVKDVKEAIKILKERLKRDVEDEIDKIFGDKLI